MKTTTLIIGLSFFMLGCANSTKDKHSIGYVDSSSIDNHKIENSLVYRQTKALWEYQFDTISNEFKPVKLRKFSRDTLSIQKIAEIINATWPKVQIKYLRTSKDTIFISIPESEVLTQQMGTTGADEFMISTTYSFTELYGIKYVSYDFEPGDHANPGVYSRNSWDKK